FAESEPGEVVNGAVAGRLERWRKCQDRECECGDLSDDRERCCGRAPRVGQTENDQRSRERRRGNQPKIRDDPAHARITSTITRLGVAPARLRASAPVLNSSLKL